MKFNRIVFFIFSINIFYIYKNMLFSFESNNKFDASCSKKLLYHRNIGF